MKHLAFLSLCILAATHAWAQDGARELTLTLDQAVAMAQAQSPTAQAAKHTFLAAEWQYRYYKANYLPSVTLSSSPYLNREVNKINLGDGTSYFARQNQLGTDLSLKINQNVAFTGGSFFVKTSLNRLDELERRTTFFSSQPVLVGYQQSFFGYNTLKWDRRIEPLRYREARKNYAEAMQLVAAQATNRFFGLVLAQANLDMARLNFASADTLYTMARGRYSIGSVNENEMLGLEINRLNEETACMDAEVGLEEQMQSLRSYLGLGQDVEVRLVMPQAVPDISLDIDEAMERAMRNGSDRDYYDRMRLEGRSRLAQAKANSRLRADLYLQFGLSQTGGTLAESLRHPQHQEYASLTLAFPILDWGRSRGQVRVAQSQLDLIDTQADQGMNDFRQNVQKLVMQFNMQARRVNVAARTSEQAERRYDASRHLYVQGRGTFLDLNAAIAEKDRARRSHIASIQTWWALYYTIHSIIGSDDDGLGFLL